MAYARTTCKTLNLKTLDPEKLKPLSTVARKQLFSAFSSFLVTVLHGPSFSECKVFRFKFLQLALL